MLFRPVKITKIEIIYTLEAIERYTVNTYNTRGPLQTQIINVNCNKHLEKKPQTADYYQAIKFKTTIPV